MAIALCFRCRGSLAACSCAPWAPKPQPWAPPPLADFLRWTALVAGMMALSGVLDPEEWDNFDLDALLAADRARHEEDPYRYQRTAGERP